LSKNQQNQVYSQIIETRN